MSNADHGVLTGECCFTGRIYPSETRSTPAATPTTPSSNAHGESGRVIDDVALKTSPVRDSVDISDGSDRIADRVTTASPINVVSTASPR